MSNIAIIPARGGSKRLPRKNILPLAGKPIIAYPIQTALDSGVFDKVIVSTEDAEIEAIAKQYGAEVISRPDELATDEAHELDACLHVIDFVKEETSSDPDAFCVLYPTAAFMNADDIKQSLERLNQAPAADVVMGVTEYPIHPYKTLLEGDDSFLSLLFPKEAKIRSQFYPKATASCGTFYWLRTSSFRELRTYSPEKLRGYVLPAERAIDIDTKEDFIIAEKLKSAQRL